MTSSAIPDDTDDDLPDAQKRAIARQESHGTPYARSRAEGRAEAALVADHVGLRHSPVAVTTWLSAAGDEYALHYDTTEDGHRIVVLRWHSTGEITVRRIFGSWWRARRGREGVEYASKLLTADDGVDALIAAVREVAATGDDGGKPLA